MTRVEDTSSRDGVASVRSCGVPRLMTAQEVSELLRVPRSTIYELARSRRIPFVKVGRRTLFVQQALLEWIASQTVPPRS